MKWTKHLKSKSKTEIKVFKKDIDKILRFKEQWQQKKSLRINLLINRLDKMLFSIS
jgi:hypothetical protein